jgi:hypothetical protein
MSDDQNKKRDGEEESVADMLRDPEFAQSSYEQRVKYFNLPQVQRQRALTRAEKIKPKGKPN